MIMSEIPLTVRYKVSVDRATDKSNNSKKQHIPVEGLPTIVFEGEMWNLSLADPQPLSEVLKGNVELQCL